MKSTLNFDYFMVFLGLATIVVQWGLHLEEKKDAHQTALQTNQATVIPASQPASPSFDITYPQGSPYLGLTWPDSLQPNPFERVKMLSRANADNPNWAGKDTDMRILLEAHKGQPYYSVLQQLVANEMLRNELFHHYYQDPASEGMLEGISFYTQQLLEADSEDAKLMYMSLRALKDYWPREQIAEAAQATAQNVFSSTNPAAADTTSAVGYYKQIYARQLKKMGASAEKISSFKL